MAHAVRGHRSGVPQSSPSFNQVERVNIPKRHASAPELRHSVTEVETHRGAGCCRWAQLTKHTLPVLGRAGSRPRTPEGPPKGPVGAAKERRMKESASRHLVDPRFPCVMSPHHKRVCVDFSGLRSDPIQIKSLVMGVSGRAPAHSTKRPLSQENVYLSIYLSICIYLYIYMIHCVHILYLHLYTSYIFGYIYICLYVYMYIYVYIYICDAVPLRRLSSAARRTLGDAYTLNPES